MALVGANVGVAKVLSEALPIALVAFLRCVLACLVLWPMARLRDGRGAVPGRAVLGNLALQAVFGTAIYNAGLLAGLRLTGALEAGLVLSTLPAVVALGAAALLRERVPPRAWAAVALAVAVSPLFLLKKGKDATIPPGYELQAAVANEVEIE